MIFATIGTQAPFDRFVRMVDEIAAGLNEEVIVQTIGTHYEPKNIRVVDFLPPDEFNEVFARARMVIAHAGMGTILSALPTYARSIGKQFGVVPFPTTVYVLGTGENHSILTGVGVSWKRTVEGLLRIPRRIARARQAEYNIR